MVSCEFTTQTSQEISGRPQAFEGPVNPPCDTERSSLLCQGTQTPKPLLGHRVSRDRNSESANFTQQSLVVWTLQWAFDQPQELGLG